MITIDWERQSYFPAFDNFVDPSANALLSVSESKELSLNVMLKNNPLFEEVVACPKCGHDEAMRKTKITQYPNILIVIYVFNLDPL